MMTPTTFTMCRAIVMVRKTTFGDHTKSSDARTFSLSVGAYRGLNTKFAMTTNRLCIWQCAVRRCEHTDIDLKIN